MAKQLQEAATNHSGFKTVQLLKDEVLGIGSYGKVCQAKCDDLLCAAKIIHPTLFDPNLAQGRAGGKGREHRLPMRRFEQECKFLSTIRHPNIVQYLGTHQDSDTDLPVLLMELMDDSLTHFLESSPQPIPYHIQVNICHDISRALSYLHNRQIVHRDLSSNNVLMIGSVRAKVTDFGMARLSDLHSQPKAHFTITMCPGTSVYMPPEALDENPSYLLYTEKIDCFSLGVLTVQILTREFPKPGDRQVVVDDSRYPRKLRMDVPEIERRQNHISRVDPNHPLLPIVLDCLKDADGERPSAQQLCERLAALKDREKYTKSIRKEREKFEKKDTDDAKEITLGSEQKAEVFEDISLNVPGERRTAAASQEQEIRRLRRQAQEMLSQHREEVRRVEREKDRAVEEKEKQLQIAREKLEEREEMIAFYEERFNDMKQPLHQPNYKGCGLWADPAPKAIKGVAVGATNKKSMGGASITGLKWTRGNKAPCKINQWNDAIINGHMIYFRMGVVIYSYDTKTDARYRLPECPYSDCSIAVVDGLLTTIGGRGLNQLFSLTTERAGQGAGPDQEERRWMEKFPPMPTKRNSTTALCTADSLLVAGGCYRGVTLATVEVMDIQTRHWSTVASLPEPLCYSSVTLCGDDNQRVILLGGNNQHKNPTKSVYSCDLSDLLKSSKNCTKMVHTRVQDDLNVLLWSGSHHSRKRALTDLDQKSEKISSKIDSNAAPVWNRIADLPVTYSSCVSFHGNLLAIGGRSSTTRLATTDVHVYQPSTNQWTVVSHMTKPRRQCFTGVLQPDHQLIVVGGETSNEDNDIMEIATL